jgi:hypothetical protein
VVRFFLGCLDLIVGPVVLVELIGLVVVVAKDCAFLSVT